MFANWIEDLPYKEIIIVAGNHDHYMAHGNIPFKRARYLMNSGCEVFGLKIWGSPYTPKFGPYPFMKERNQMKIIWAHIPKNLDILITHGPAYGILDMNDDHELCGCKALLEQVNERKPKIHIFGHIHEGYGEFSNETTKFLNVSYLDENYVPIHSYTEIKIP